MITKKQVRTLFTKEQQQLIWNALHTYVHIERNNGVLLKSELKAFNEIEPIFKSNK